jgi:hypothetical protein
MVARAASQIENRTELTPVIALINRHQEIDFRVDIA